MNYTTGNKSSAKSKKKCQPGHPVTEAVVCLEMMKFQEDVARRFKARGYTPRGTYRQSVEDGVRNRMRRAVYDLNEGTATLGDKMLDSERVRLGRMEALEREEGLEAEGALKAKIEAASRGNCK